MNTHTEIRTYTACLAAYNDGILHGCWIDAHQDADDSHSETCAMLAASSTEGVEEFAIRDYEGLMA
ncbi:antirestriction protein ArdA [Eoetvoesiella caeni]